MKMKLWLYVGFFAVFAFIFSQIAFPLGAKVISINVWSAESEENICVFNDIRNNIANSQKDNYEYFVKDTTLEDINDYHFIEYEVGVESTRLIPIKILNSKISVDLKYKDRVVLRATEPYEREVLVVKSLKKKFKLLVDTKDMSQDEIREMIKDIDIHITWKVMLGWERVNKVYLPEGSIAFKSIPF